MKTEIDPVEAANIGEPMTERFDRYDGRKFLRPAYYPDAEVLVSTLPVAHERLRFMAQLVVEFGGGGWTIHGVGETPREAVQDLHRALSALGS